MMDKHNDIEAIIVKSLQGQASRAEEQALQEWLGEGPEQGRRYEQVKSLWEAAGEVDFSLDPDTGREWERLAARLPPAGRTAGVKALRFPAWRFAAAAVVLAGLLGLLVLYFGGPGGPAVAQEFTALPGERQEAQLPDGTRLALNAGSRLQMLEGFNQEERRLRLEGEAYFQVAANAEKPFFIEAEGAQVRITGTAFNLRAYPEDAAVRLTVTEGSVRFSPVKKGAGRVLAAGNAAGMDKASGRIRAIPFDERAAAWQSGILVFDNTPWPEALRSLARYYALEVTDETKLQNKRYSAVFDNQPLEATLQVMQATLGFEAELKGRRLLLK